MKIALPRILAAGQVTRKIADYAADVTRVEQQTSFYCGAACSVMVLRRFGIEVDQPTAYTTIHNEARFAVEQLYSDPAGIQGFLDQNLSELKIDVNIVAADSFEEAAHQIVQSLAFYEFPGMVLVQGGNHWVTVDSVRVQEAPNGQMDVVGVIVENPWYNKTAHTYVAVDEFQLRWLEPNKWGETWKGKYVVVARTGPDTGRALSLLSLQPSSKVMVVAKESPPGIMTRDSLEMQAINGMALHGFDDVKAIGGGGAAVVTPIRILDEHTSAYYWIIPVDATSEKQFADFCYVAISEETGGLLEVSRVSAELDILNDSEVQLLLAGIYPHANIEVDPQYRWIPAYEVLSRFDIARRATVDGTALIVLRGGVVVSSLTNVPRFGG
ncbi:hypothetical protein [Rhizobium leguminosarum]|uniref:hypothetical protein n=1 Tax=Rhizobium leguminosarum TaxID=384 RepID=UPI001C973F72|nr:hypothetical protein [Rhizobium leguminosarum]MBY5426994.1 hypothetical protein [Rhizobium leguminosarum]